MRTFRSTFIFLAVAALLGGYIYFFERGPEKKKEEKPRKIFNFVADDVQGIRIENLGTTLMAQKAPLQLQKDDKGVWQILEPKKFKADENSMRAALDGIGNFNPETTIESPENLADFGLNSPAARFTYKLKNGTSPVLLVGDKNPVGSSTYLKTMDKQTIYLLPSSSVENVLKTKLEDYRDKEILKTDMVTAKKVHLTRAGKSIFLEKDKDNNWNLSEPMKDKADSGKVREILNQVNNLRVDQFENDHPVGLAGYGLSPARGEVEIWPSDGGPSKRVLWGKQKTKTNSIYAKVGDLPYVYLINQYFDKSMDVKLNDLRDKSVMKFDSGAAKKLFIQRLKQVYVYQKNDKGVWQSAVRPKADEEGTALINLLSQTAISDFVAKGAKTGLLNPIFTAEVTLGDGSVRKYVFGNREKDKIYLASDKSKDIYLVQAQVLSQMDGYFSFPIPPQSVSSPTPVKK